MPSCNPASGSESVYLLTAPITYDSGDGSLDSTTLIDNFQWVLKPGTKVGTTPVPR